MSVKNLHITNHENEINRLISNGQGLLNTIPLMVVLVNKAQIIEYMNPAAKIKFGDLRGCPCTDHLCKEEDRLLFKRMIKQTISGEEVTTITKETKIGKLDVEYNAIPFEGYKDHYLVMLIYRDITIRKKHIKELENFNNSIEEVLNVKINALNESEKIRKQLIGEVNHLKRKLNQKCAIDGMIGTSKKLTAVKELAYQVAQTDTTVLITGESGTGKELIANLIHKNSKRSNMPFLKINCNAINDNLLESTLFGHEKGSFTGATSCQKGKFETVNGGTILLDEIGDISLRMQTSLLRVLQNKEIIRVGGNKPLKIDVRIIAATNVDLAKAIDAKTFRLDLFYRLNVINIKMPNLRERKADIVDLATHFVNKYREAFNKDISFLPNGIIDLLLQHDWPGNVRELENVIQRAVLMADSNTITTKNIVFDHSSENLEKKGHGYFNALLSSLQEIGLKNALATCEKDLIENTLRENNGNVSQTSRNLGISKTVFYDKLKRHGIQPNSIRCNPGVC